MKHLAGTLISLMVIAATYWFVYTCLTGAVVTR